MILLLRASHANEFELQNYAPLAKSHNIKVVTSKRPLTRTTIPQIKLWSPTDLPNFPLRRQILNRLIGGEQWLIGLEKTIQDLSKRYNDLNHCIVNTAETYTPYTHQAVQLKKKGKIKKLVCTCWETIPHNNEKFARLRKWKREAYQWVDIFHTPTERAKKALVKEGVDPKKIVVIPYGVDLARFKPVKRRPNNRPLILTVARLEKEKGMEDLEQVARALPQYDFLVVGKGSYLPEGSNIKIKEVQYSQIHKTYQMADIFFLPSHTTKTWEEQYGMVLVEAMACGLPIVATASGAIPEILNSSESPVNEGKIQNMVRQILTIIADKYLYKDVSQKYLNLAKANYNSKVVSLNIFQQIYRYN